MWASGSSVEGASKSWDLDRFARRFMCSGALVQSSRRAGVLRQLGHVEFGVMTGALHGVVDEG